MLNSSFISYDKDREDKIVVGVDSFTIDDLIRYIFGSDNRIIEKYICKRTDDTIILNTINKSELMGNLGILIKIYNGLRKYDSEIKNKDRKKYINFMNIYLNHLLKLIININEKTKDKDIKYKLLNYSIIITHQLLQYTREEYGIKGGETVPVMNNGYLSDD